MRSQWDNSREWYLSDFGVPNVNKPGRVRLVFEAVAKSSSFNLNDQLWLGLNLSFMIHGSLADRLLLSV